MSVDLSKSEAWWAEPGHPRLTHHLHERWFDRTPAHAVSPEAAWSDGEEVPAWALPRLAGNNDAPDRARVYGGDGYSVVIIASYDPCLTAVTVIRVEALHDPAARRCVWELAEEVRES